MKIKKYKKENINEDSKNTFIDYSKKQISINIFYHKIFLGLCIFANIGLFFFILMYNKQLKKIESSTKIYSREFIKNDNLLINKRTTIDHKLVNLISINRKKSLLFAYSFINKKEFEMVQNFITDYYKNNPLQYDENIFEKYKLQLIYQTSSSNKVTDFYDIFHYHRNCLLIIHTIDNSRLGIYIDEPMIFNENKEFFSNENRLFIFSFQSKSMHKYIGNEHSLKVYQNGRLEIGNKEIIINENFFNNGGLINYPLKSFENLNEYDNFFCQQNGKFDIKNIEIFAFYLDKERLYKSNY